MKGIDFYFPDSWFYAANHAHVVGFKMNRSCAKFCWVLGLPWKILKIFYTNRATNLLKKERVEVRSGQMVSNQRVGGQLPLAFALVAMRAAERTLRPLKFKVYLVKAQKLIHMIPGPSWAEGMKGNKSVKGWIHASVSLWLKVRASSMISKKHSINQDSLSFYLLLVVCFTDVKYSTLPRIFVFTIWTIFVAEW